MAGTQMEGAMKASPGTVTGQSLEVEVEVVDEAAEQRCSTEVKSEDEGSSWVRNRLPAGSACKRRSETPLRRGQRETVGGETPGKPDGKQGRSCRRGRVRRRRRYSWGSRLPRRRRRGGW